MKKVTSTGEKHRQTELIAGLDGVSVTHAASGMDHGRDSLTRSETHGVVEGKETITRQHSTLDLVSGGLQGDAGGTDTIHLARTDAKALA